MSPVEREPDHGSEASQRLLKADRENFRAIFDHSPLPMLVCDVGSLSILAANPLAARLHGQAPQELVGRSLFELRQVSDLTQVMLKRAAGREIGLGFGYHQRGDGSLVPVQLSVYPSELAGRPAWLCVLKGLEDALGAAPDERERRLFEAVGRIAGGVAHDINNLLSVILSFGSLAESQLPAESTAREDLAEIRGAAERANALTRQLLSFSRKGPTTPKPLQLNDLVRRVEKLLRRLLDERLTLELALDPELDHVLADAAQVERLLLQLASEARATAAHGGRLLIETRNAELDAEHGELPHVVLSVSDSGNSLSPEIATRVFEPLAGGRAPPAGPRGAPLAEAGSNAWLESEPGLGTRFVACFPSLRAHERSRSTLPPPAVRQPRGRCVLLVEDNPHAHRTLAAYFLRAGYRVLDAESSLHAVQLAEREPQIDLLLASYALSDGTGPDLARALRQQLPNLCVVIALATADQRSFVAENERTACLLQPFDLERFGEVLEDLLAPQA